MNEIVSDGKRSAPYLTAAGAWALAFGCSVGWGAFVMPGTTFLPLAGPVGTCIGIALGAIVMIVLAKNYGFLINRYPDGGGTYTFTKKAFGYDHGFLSAWFLLLTYVAIIWANASALPLIARTLLGGTFQFGFHYEIAGFHVYMGEIILAVGSLVVAALICLRKKLSQWTQIVSSVLLFGGIVACFAAAMGGRGSIEPAFSPDHAPVAGTFTIFALTPWAFVGFESVCHSAGEAKYPLKKTFRVMTFAIIAAGVAYAALSVLAVTARPDGAASWTEYVAGLGTRSGLESQPTFFAAFAALGPIGPAVLGVAALCGIFTGLIGNFIALSRLVSSMSEDGLIPESVGRRDKNGVPGRAILIILAISVPFPFLGRTAISWIVDVTTVGAVIAYAFASAAAFRTAREEKNRAVCVTGIAGLIFSLLFAAEFLIPNISPVKALSTESYLILAAWGILGFIVFKVLLNRDTERRLGRSTIAWIVLLGLVIFTSSVWMRQNENSAIERSIAPIQEYYNGELEKAGIDTISGATKPAEQYLREVMDGVDRTLVISTVVQIALIVVSLVILFGIYSTIQKRERQTEVEKLLAEESSRAKTSFLSNMSHEIRTPMNAIIGLDNIALRDENLSPKTRDHLEKIGASAKHLLGLINDILDMSRIESGRMVLKSEEFSFREFSEQIGVIINGQCADKGLTYECRLAGDLRDFYIGDDMKLKQVLINILGNAVKFTDAPGRVSLTAEETGSDGEKCFLRFTVKDTGVGMDKEYIPKIFEAFSQEDATSTNRYGGSGLGMAITKNFVDMMGGRIDVESEKGVGTTFTVTVPLGISEKKAGGDSAGDTADLTALRGRRVLIAEDVDENAEILSDLLELEDVAAERAQNGQIAVSMFEKSEPGYYDVILMDVRMPVMDGLSATKAIRALSRPDAASVPIIAMTANVFEEDVGRSIEAGMNAHLSKPVEPDRLYASMAELISRKE